MTAFPRLISHLPGVNICLILSSPDKQANYTVAVYSPYFQRHLLVCFFVI
jgi:hypothetical protein